MKSKTTNLKTIKFRGGVGLFVWVFQPQYKITVIGLVVTLYCFDKKLMRIQKGLDTASTSIVKRTKDFQKGQRLALQVIHLSTERKGLF